MATFEQFRALMPELDGMTEREAVDAIAKRTGVDRNALAADLGVQNTGFLKEVGKGVARTIDQLQGTGYAGLGMAADTVGLSGARDWALEGFKRNIREAAQNPAAVPSYENVHGVGDSALYVGSTIGETLPQLIPGLGAAGLGAKVAGNLAAKQIAQKGLTGAAAKKLTEAAVLGGAQAGGSLYGMGSETANIYGDIYERTGELRPGVALAHGLPAGLVEGLGERVLFKGAMGGRPQGMGRARYAGQEAGKQFLTEGVAEELPQTIIEQHALNTVDPTIGYDTKEMIDATLKGGIGGGVVGGTVGALTPTQQTKERIGDFRRDPLGTTTEVVGDGIAATGDKLGALFGAAADKLETFLQRRSDKQAGLDPDVAEAMRHPQFRDMALERARKLGPEKAQRMEALFAEQDAREALHKAHSVSPMEEFLAPVQAGAYTKEVDDQKVAQAKLVAEQIMNDQREFNSSDLRATAIRFLNPKLGGNVKELVDALNAANKGGRYDSMINSMTGGAKFSMMRTSPTAFMQPGVKEPAVLNALRGDQKELVYKLVGLGDEALKAKLAALPPEQRMTFDEAKKLRDEAAQYAEKVRAQREAKPGDMQRTADGDVVWNLAKLWQKEHGSKMDADLFDGSEDANRVAAQLMMWLKTGMGAELNDGKPMVPEALIDELGDNAPAAVQTAAQLLKGEGLIDDKQLGEAQGMFDQMVERVVASKNDSAFLEQHMKPLTKAMMTPAKLKSAVRALRQLPEYLKIGTLSQDLKNDIGKYYNNVDEVIAHFAGGGSKAYQNKQLGMAKQRSEPVATATTVDEQGNLVLSDEQVESEVPKYGAGYDVVSPEDRTQLIGPKKDGVTRPYNLADEKARATIDTVVGAHENEPGTFVREIGVWKHAREQLKGEDLTQAEDELLSLYASQLAEGGKYDALVRRFNNMQGVFGDVGLSEKQRKTLLGLIDRQFRYVQVEKADSGANIFKLTKDQIADFRSEYVRNRRRDKTQETPENGYLYLERKINGELREFPTHTTGLLNHRFGKNPKTGQPRVGVKEEDGRTNAEQGQGAKGSYELLRQAITDLVTADKAGFTGRIGVRENGEIRWLEANEPLPNTLKVGQRATVAQAKLQEASERRQEPEGSPWAVRYAETPAEKKAELKRLANLLAGTPAGDAIVKAILKGAPTIARKYTELRNKYNSNADVVGGDAIVSETNRDDVVPSEAPDELQTGIRREDPKGNKPIQRDTDGRAAGLDAKAAGAGYGGNARGGKGAHREPVNTTHAESVAKAERELAALDRLETARDWVVATIRQNVDALLDKIGLMNNKQLDVLETAVASLSKLTGGKLGKLYLEGDTGKGRVLAGRLARAAERIKSKIEETQRTLEADGRNPKTNDVERSAEAATDRARSTDTRGQEAGVAARAADTGDAVQGRAGASGQGRARDVAQQLQAYLKLAEEQKRPAIFINALKHALDLARKGEITPTVQGALARAERVLGALAEEGTKFSRMSTDDIKTWDNMQPGDLVTLYRGENAANEANGQWWTTDRSVAERYGKVTEVTLPAEVISKHAARGHNGAHEFVFGSKRPTELAAGLEGEQQPSAEQKSPEDTAEAVEAARDYITRTLGDTVEALFEETLGGVSGSWTPGEVQSTIRVALNGDILGTAFHESMHEFVKILKKHGGWETKALLERVAQNGIVNRQIMQLLKDHPEAQKQVLSSPEEAVAFLYQFWAAGQLRLGPETKGFFNKVKAFLGKVLKAVAGMLNENIRQQNLQDKRDQNERLQVEQVFKAFFDGKVASGDTAVREAVIGALEKQTEAVGKANKAIDGALGTMMDKLSKLAFSAEAVMELTNNPYIIGAARRFHQAAGTAMAKFAYGDGKQAIGGYFEGVKQETEKRMNQLRHTLTKYDPEDLKIAREALAKGRDPEDIVDPVIKKIVSEVRKFFDDMATYIDESDIRRLENGKWEKVVMRKGYWPQVYDLDTMQQLSGEFTKDLIKRHMDELERIAEEANEEAIAGIAKGENTAADIELRRAAKAWMEQMEAARRGEGPLPDKKLPIETITPEQVAEAITLRVMNTGHVALEETTSNLGLTPAASAVNRRQLSWIDPEVFDKYMSHDMANIMTTYTRSIVKRGEYQKRFGYDGNKIQDAFDRATLYELGGEDLIEMAQEELKEAVKAWRERGDKSEQKPTLLSVGLDLHRQDVGDEAHNKAMIDVEQKLRAPRKAVQAMEGTLGADIKPALRAANSWLTTYTNFRILSMSLFTSFQDVNGIIINGGTLGEAWETFVAGIKGVRESWKKNGGTPDDMMREAEFWGTVDAGSVMDVIGETYGSVYMTGAAKKLSDGFFRAIGMEGWNRGIRAKATQVAVRCIVDMARNPEAYTSDPAKKAQFERLFGQGADPKDIRLTADGKLDRSSAANVAAVTRWVLDAVPAPNAAVRTIWMSDPRFQTFAHLKNYTYTWHRTIMRSAIEQARLGNYRPATVAALGYIPIAIAAGALKEMLIPGDEPAWMKSGMAGAMSYGVQRAGVLGVPQMYLGDALEGDLARVLGPFWDEMQNIATIPLGETETKLPLGAKIGWKDHTLGHEFANALPFGNLAVRVADAW